MFEPSLIFPASCVYRAGVASFTRLYAERYGPANIRTNCMLQGFIDGFDHPAERATTVPMKHVGTVAEAAKALAFLLSDDSSYLTGRGLRVDRPPCGTGSNANMAVRRSKGCVAVADTIVSRSIIGGEFTTELLAEETVGAYPAARNRISGQRWIYGITQIGLDPSDPFPTGFCVSDTWGKLPW